MGGGGHADEVGHGQQGAAGGDGVAGAASQAWSGAGDVDAGGAAEFLQGGGDDDGDGQSVVGAELVGGQQHAGHGQEGVVVALGGATGVAAGVRARRLLGRLVAGAGRGPAGMGVGAGLLTCRFLRAAAAVVRFGLGAGCGIGGVAVAGALIVGMGCPGGGEFGGEGVPAGAGFGGEVARDSAHAVGLLAADGQSAFALSFFLVGHRAVGVEGQGESLGGLAQLIGVQPAGRAGELGFGVGAGADVDPVGQGAEELGDGVQVSGSDAALGLSGGDVIPVWGQGLAVEGAAGAEHLGVADGAGGFGFGQAQGDGEDFFPGFGAQGLGFGFGHQPGQDGVFDRG